MSLPTRTPKALRRATALRQPPAIRHASSSSSSSSPAKYNGTTFPLNTGARIPGLGFGTWQDAAHIETATLAALRAGYRHIDTARIYGTEKAVGNALKRSGVPREEVFVTTKLWNNAHHPDRAGRQLEESLNDLGVGWVDAWLMHWPSPFADGDTLMPRNDAGKLATGPTDYLDTWAAMISFQRAGLTKSIGVSNFSQPELTRLLSHSSVVPAIHQIELHPWLPQRDFAAWHAEKGIHVTQYSPLGNANPIYDKGRDMARLIADPTVVDVAAKYGKNGAQVVLAWGLAHGRSVIPKSKTEARVEENLGGDFVMEKDDVERLDGLGRALRLNDPSKAFGWNFYEGGEGKV